MSHLGGCRTVDGVRPTAGAAANRYARDYQRGHDAAIAVFEDFAHVVCRDAVLLLPICRDAAGATPASIAGDAGDVDGIYQLRTC